MDEKRTPLAKKNWPFYILMAAICFANRFFLNGIAWEPGESIAAWGVFLLTILLAVILTLVRKRLDWWLAGAIFLGSMLGNPYLRDFQLDIVNVTLELSFLLSLPLYYIAIGCGVQSILAWRARKSGGLDADGKSAPLARKNWPLYLLLAAIGFFPPFFLGRIEWGELLVHLMIMPPVSIVLGLVITLVQKRFDWWLPLAMLLGYAAGFLGCRLVLGGFDLSLVYSEIWLMPSLYYIAAGCGVQSILAWRARKSQGRNGEADCDSAK